MFVQTAVFFTSHMHCISLYSYHFAHGLLWIPLLWNPSYSSFLHSEFLITLCSLLSIPLLTVPLLTNPQPKIIIPRLHSYSFSFLNSNSLAMSLHKTFKLYSYFFKYFENFHLNWDSVHQKILTSTQNWNTTFTFSTQYFALDSSVAFPHWLYFSEKYI